MVPVFFIVALLLVSVLVGVFLFYFTRKARLSIADYVIVSTSILVCCLPIAVLPADVDSAMKSTTDSFDEDRVMWKDTWTAIFWLIQIYSWIIIPMHQSYVTAGGFSFLHNIRLALRENVILYGIMGALAVVSFIFLVAVRDGITSSEVLELCIALSNAQGLISVLLLMGYGLVEFPKAFWRHGNETREKHRMEYLAVSLHDDKEEAQLTLSDSKREIEQLVSGPIEDMASYYKKSGDKTVVKLNATHKKASITVTKAHVQWQRLVDAYFKKHHRFYHGLFKIGALLMAVISIIFLYSECTLAGDDRSASVVYHIVKIQPALFSFLCLLYVCGIGYGTLLRVRVFSFYEMVPSYSDTNTLQFFSLFLSRVVIPICNNVNELMGVEGTAFQEVFDVAVLGTRAFNSYVPIILVPLVIISIFDAWSRLAEWLGLSARFEHGSKDKSKEEDQAMGRTLLSAAQRTPSTMAMVGRDLESGRKGPAPPVASAALRAAAEKSDKSKSSAIAKKYLAKLSAPTQPPPGGSASSSTSKPPSSFEMRETKYSAARVTSTASSSSTNGVEHASLLRDTDDVSDVESRPAATAQPQKKPRFGFFN
eukprot:ANDGO_06053.mRNA.1 LMBR1 domain-containing protein 2 homolog A